MRDRQRQDKNAEKIAGAARREDGVASGVKTEDAGNAASAKVQTLAAAAAALVPPGAAVAPPALQAAIPPSPVKDDPWKSAFGGAAERAGVRLSATVLPYAADQFAIELRILPLNDAARQRLRATAARLYLHPTFRDFIREISFGANGEFRLPLLAYGAFTVGLQLHDNNDLLELDLAKLPDAPDLFRLR